jgi:K+-transporting ATPase ATPase A chain
MSVEIHNSPMLILRMLEVSPREIWRARVRFGIAGSALTAVVTSNPATGSYNSMHDSFSSLGGMVLLVNMLLGELIFGGLGSGIYSMVTAAGIVFRVGAQDKEVSSVGVLA